MKRNVSLTALILLGLTGIQTRAAEAPPALKDQKDKFSYTIGIQVGTSVKQQTQLQGIDVNADLLMRGVKDAFTGGKTLLTEQEIRDTVVALQRDLMDKQAAIGEKNKKDGEAFLAENKKKAGVKVLPSGLQYLVVKEGKGQKPKATDTVKANYKGALINGTEFDSSEKHGGPASFSLSGVIPGWTEALQLMPVGSKWRLFIPSDLAYREQGAGSVIGPNSALVFDVELIGIETDAQPDK